MAEYLTVGQKVFFPADKCSTFMRPPFLHNTTLVLKGVRPFWTRLSRNSVFVFHDITVDRMCFRLTSLAGRSKKSPTSSTAVARNWGELTHSLTSLLSANCTQVKGDDVPRLPASTAWRTLRAAVHTPIEKDSASQILASYRRGV
jgi:hypothetical protein